MDQADWTTAVMNVLAASPLAGLEFKRTAIPSETEDIGGGAGVSMTINMVNGRQIAAITRYEAGPDDTILLIMPEVPGQLDTDLRTAGQHIATATDTTLHIQSAGVVLH